MGHTIPSDKNKELGAPWIDTAQQEIGVTEYAGKEANPRILEYFKASGFWKKDDSGEESAWCGMFAAWVMKKNGITPPKESYRAKEWQSFGQRLDKPVYGALGIKTRKKGGHVTFIVGLSKDGAFYYALGGNQDDTVKVSRYPSTGWIGFVFPPGMASVGTLPIYDGVAERARSEA
jgi:uncharacterized protein (TIGR02594 family)